MGSVAQFQVIDSTGEVVGGGIKPYFATLHGWMFSNSAVTAYEVDFYKNTDPSGGSGPTAPSVSGTKIFTIQVPANASKEFVFDSGIDFKYGIFAKASNAAVTGGVIWS